MAIKRTFKPDDGKRLGCRRGEQRTEYLEPGSGLRLRVSSTGARTWGVTYYAPIARTTRRLRIGSASRVSLAEARKLARAAVVAAEAGRDPFAERLAAREAEVADRARRAEERRQQAAERKRRGVTFGSLANAYVEARRTTPSGRYRRPASPRTLAAWDGILTNHVLPVVGAVPIGEVRIEDFVRVLEGAVKNGGPSMGPRVREFISAVWRWTESRSRLLGVRLPPESPLAGLPEIGAATVERDRVLSPAELWHLWRATEAEGLPGLAVRLMLFTAARVREATHLRRLEVDFQAKAWALPADRNKSHRDRVVPLSRQAVTVLQAAEALGRREHVFGPPTVAGLTAMMGRLRAATGGPPWQLRDLRRTAATVAARCGAEPFEVALLLGHASTDSRVPAVTAVYARWKYDDRIRAALERVGEWVEETVTAIEAPGAIADFRGARS